MMMEYALEKLVRSTKKPGEDYDPEMPRISKISMMEPQEVFEYLSILKTSIYKDMPIAQIRENITITEGNRYLTELSILNEKEKSKLEDISDKSIGQE